MQSSLVLSRELAEIGVLKSILSVNEKNSRTKVYFHSSYKIFSGFIEKEIIGKSFIDTSIVNMFIFARMNKYCILIRV